MSDNELLLAIADIMDKKIKSALGAELQPIKDDIRDMKHRMTNIELHLENVTDKTFSYLQKIMYPQRKGMKKLQHRLKLYKPI